MTSPRFRDRPAADAPNRSRGGPTWVSRIRWRVRDLPARYDRSLGRVVVRVSGAAARRPRRTIAAWLVGIVLLAAVGSLTGTRALSAAAVGTGESERADARLAAAGLTGPPVENVLVRSSDAPTTTSVVVQLQERLAGVPAVATVAGPGQVPQLVTDGGRTALVRVTLRGAASNADSTVAPVVDVVAAVAAAHPGVSVEQAGDGSVTEAIDTVLRKDLRRAELVSLPLILLVLLVVFGSLVAAAVPLLFALTCVLGTLGALGPVSQLVPMADAAPTLVVLIGLAVGVDYSLFLTRRERAERRAGAGREAALTAAVAGTSRAIVVAGMTVAVALAGLLLTGMALFASMAVATMLVVAIAVVGSVTVLPAVLALLGDRLDAGRLRLPARRPVGLGGRSRRRRGADGGGSGRLAGVVSRHPLAALVSGVAVLAAVAAPALGLRTGDPGIDVLPSSVPVVAASHHIAEAFPGASIDGQLVVQGAGLGTPMARAALSRLAAAAVAATGGHGPTGVTVAVDQRTALVAVAMPAPAAASAGGTSPDRIVAALRAQLRGDLGDRPGLGALHGAHVLVTGGAAQTTDFTERLHTRTPLTIVAVLVVAFVLLLLSFGSAALALAVTGLNLLSVGAAYGILTAVFQHSWAAAALGFTPTGAVVQWVPLFAFVILFGLSMDYTVLVLERIGEARSHGLAADRAVVAGVGATGGTVTAAAVVMVAVFALFAALRLVAFKQVGVGLAAAVALDATLVRGVALPAAVCLLGGRGWPVPPAGRVTVGR